MLRRNRRQGPGLVNTMARTAVIAGTATATSNAVNRSAMQKQQAHQEAVAKQNAVTDLQQQVAQLEAQQMQQVAAPAASDAAPQSELVAKLQQLADLHAQGILSDEEFAQAKARALS